MDWIRENKVLATIMGIALAGVVGLGAVLYMSWSSYAEAQTSFQTTDSSLAAMKGRSLAPTPENLEAKRTQVKKFADSVSQMIGTLLALQPEVKPISDTEFQIKLKERVAAIKTAAATSGMELPADFNLAFNEYASALPRNAEAATALSDYLTGAEAIVQTLVNAGVKRLSTMERTTMAVEKEAPPPPPEPKNTKKGKGKAKATKAVPKVKEIAPIVEPRTITLTFVADQLPLQVVLNTLASPSKTEYFTAVRLLRIENGVQTGPSKAAIQMAMAKESNPEELVDPSAAPPPPPSTSPAPAPGARVIEAVVPGKKDAVDVLGAEMLTVYMEVDLIRFLETPATPEDAGK